MSKRWAIWCPLGHACGNRDGVIAKGRTEEDARECMRQHLRHAAGHEGLQEGEVEVQATCAKLEEWDEDELEVTFPGRIPPISSLPSLEEVPKLWAIRCPRGDECGWRNGVFATGTTQEDVRARLKQHLCSAREHANLDVEEIQRLVKLAKIRPWEENSCPVPRSARE